MSQPINLADAIFTSGDIAKALSVPRQTITDLLRRYGRPSAGREGWARLSLAQAIEATLMLHMIQRGIKPSLASAIAESASHVIRSEAEILGQASQQEAGWISRLYPNAMFLRADVEDATEDNEQIYISSEEALMRRRLDDEQQAKLIVIVPLSKTIQTLIANLVGEGNHDA